MNIQAFFMDDLIVCMSLYFEYSIVANKDKFLSLKEIRFIKNVVLGLHEREVIFQEREEVLESVI